jgi:quercetin dioxygenase-like cupin family protein
MRTISFKGGVEVHVLKDGRETGNEYCEFLCVIRPGIRTPMPHYHALFDETVWGRKGVVTWTVDGKATDVGPADTLFIPRGAIHHFENRMKEPIEFLCRAAPGNAFGAQYFEDIATVLNVDGLPDFRRLQDVMKSHGLIPVLGFKRRVLFAVLGVVRKLKGASTTSSALSSQSKS